MKRFSYQFVNKSMEYVAAVARRQSLTKAAQELHVTQPALSRFIHNLESDIGGSLFNRVGNRFIPTVLGECFAEYAARIQAVEGLLCGEIARQVNSVEGRIRLTLPSLRSPYVLPAIIPPFKERYPNVKLEILEMHADALIENLLSGKVDFAIINTDVPHPNVTSEVIGREPILLAIPADHPLAGIGAKREGDVYPCVDIRLFLDCEFILQHPDQRTRQVADVIFREARIEPKIAMQIRSIDTAIRLVSLGCGICFAAETFLPRQSNPLPLKIFSLNTPAAVTQLSIAYLKNAYLPRYFLDFIEIVKNKHISD